MNKNIIIAAGASEFGHSRNQPPGDRQNAVRGAA
jgi:hypothetical protein